MTDTGKGKITARYSGKGSPFKSPRSMMATNPGYSAGKAMSNTSHMSRVGNSAGMKESHNRNGSSMGCSPMGKCK